jgi:ELWxxDGT repeat protein
VSRRVALSALACALLALASSAGSARGHPTYVSAASPAIPAAAQPAVARIGSAPLAARANRASHARNSLVVTAPPSLVLDINPGGGSSSPDGITDVGGTGFFVADDGTHGFELWKTDGTAAGTTLVKDINPGATGSFPSLLTDVNGTLFFTADDGTHGSELWSSDGTAAGTTMVKDINPGGGSQPNGLVDFGGTLFFAADDGTNGRELWRSDGTAAGTTMVKDINPGGSSSPSDLVDVGGTLFFTADDGSNGEELWKSDGTGAGTQLVKDINPNPNAPSDVSQITDVNGTAFFEAFDGTFFGLWKSDGTGAGTVLLKGDGGTGASLGPQQLTNVAGTLFFTGDDGSGPSDHGRELWKSDGTSSGTVIVKDIWPGAQASNPDDLTDVNGTLFFEADDGTNGAGLWSSDGTSSGTALVKAIGPSWLTSSGGTLYFAANDGTDGSELWASDGTAAGTTLVADINPGSSGSFPGPLADVNGTLFFGADDGTHGDELWKVQGAGGGGSFSLSVTRTGSGSGTVTSSPAGISCGSACSHSFAAGTDVTLHAAAGQNSVFSGYSGACSGMTCTVHMSQARSVTATFTSNQPTALFTMPSTIRPGAVVTLNANASLNAKAYLWDLNGDGHNDVSCSTSQLQTGFMPPAGTSAASAASTLAQARLTVVSATGATSTVSQSSPFVGLGGSGISSQAVDYFYRTQGAYCVNFKQAGICITPATLYFSVIEATGCDLHWVTNTSELGPEEQNLIQIAIDQYNNTKAYVLYVKALCAIAKLVGDPANCAVAGQIDRRDITGPLSQNSILLWVSKGPVKINGLDFYPAPGHSIVISPLLQEIFSADVEVDLNGVKLSLPQKLSLNLHDVNVPLTLNASDDHRAPVGSFAVSSPDPLDVSPLATRHLALTFVRDVSDNRYTEIGATLGLPKIKPELLNDLAGNPVTLTGTFRASNANGVQLSDIDGNLPSPIGFGDFLPLRIDSVHVHYSPLAEHKPLTIFGSIHIGDADLSFAPQDAWPNNGIVFWKDGFHGAEATLDLPCPDLCIHLFPGVDLDQIHLGFAFDPTVVIGGGDLNVIDLVNVHGGLAVAFPSDTNKWKLDKSQIAQLPDDWTPRTYSGSPTVALAGDASMNLPILKDQTLANAYFVYSFPGYIAFGGGVTWNFLGIVSFDGGLSGEVNAVTKRFNFAGHLQTCVADVLCSGAFGVVSSSGAGACFVVGPVSVGGGIQFPDHVYIWPIDGCKWSRFTADNVYNHRLPAAGAAAQPYTFTTKAGDPSHAVQLDGVNDAPEVEVTGPGGIDVTSSSGDCTSATATSYNGNTCLTISGKVRIMRSPKFKETVVGVQNPAAGTYTVTPLGGSTFADAYKASDTGSLGISGSVSGSGLLRTLSYNIRQIPGEKVTFLDEYAGAAREIGTVINGGSGILKFSPPAGTALHQVVAEVELAGLPVPVPTAGPSSGPTPLAAAPRITIASFRPPKPPKLSVVSHLRAVRHGSSLAVSWRKAGGAVQYGVVVTLADKTGRTVYAKKTSARIANVARTEAGQVTVIAIAADGRKSKARHVRFKARAKAPTLQAPYPATRCTVPKVVGLAERAADKALLTAGCAEGKLKKIGSRKPKGRVLSQSRAPGSKLPIGTKVNLVLSGGRKR